MLSLAAAATSIIFVATKDVFCREKHVFVETKMSLSRQNYVCRDKSELVATKLCLSRQTFYNVKNMFVATKEILAAAPANDSIIMGPDHFPALSLRARSETERDRQRDKQTDRQHLLYTCSLSKMIDRNLRQVAVLMEVNGALFVVF